MKIMIRDTITLSSINPLNVASYLRSLGWVRSQEFGDKAALWRTTDDKGNEFELVLPQRADLGDYAARMSEVLKAIEDYSGQSQLQILYDVDTINADVVRIRAPMAQDGTLALRDGVELIRHSRDMMLAAASSSVEPRPIFFSRKPERALQYVDSVRLGQTERGSFVLTILSPVSPELHRQNWQEDRGSPGDILAEPFERKVTRSLAQSLSHVHQAATASSETNDFEPFKDAVQYGISSNLCEALVGMYESSGRANIDIGFSWSVSRPLPAEVPQRVVIPGELVPYLTEAARIFRENAEPDDIEVQGLILKLSRPRPNARGGDIIVQCFYEEKFRQIKIRLSHSNYQEAVTAHRKYQAISCWGRVVRQGNFLRLRDPHSFSVIPTEDFDAGVKHQKSVKPTQVPKTQTKLF